MSFYSTSNSKSPSKPSVLSQSWEHQCGNLSGTACCLSQDLRWWLTIFVCIIAFPEDFPQLQTFKRIKLCVVNRTRTEVTKRGLISLLVWLFSSWNNLSTRELMIRQWLRTSVFILKEQGFLRSFHIQSWLWMSSLLIKSIVVFANKIIEVSC